MKISTKGRYALRLMIDLAQHNTDSYIALKEIAIRQNISIKYLEQIINVLCKSGFLKSLRGSQGGYKLARQPLEYTVGEILRVIEGELVPVACLQDDTNQCERCDICETIGFWNGLYDVINNYVDNTTLHDLAILNAGKEKENINSKTE
ncbi:MAG: Rrf2 family transcriptional regulator [Clostridiales bacterium]|nr:Rrf2 family transcriptional regulator [Clostridiales bacterium]